MGLEKTHGQNYDLGRILAGIDSGKVVLPEFQRDFLWDTLAVRQLIATCVSGWPLGSLLLLPGQANIFFRTRAVESAPKPQPPYQSVVLDGQQRLTGLYQALFEKGPFRYAVKLTSLALASSIDELDEAIVAIPAGNWDSLYRTPKDQHASGYLPIAALRRASTFYAWRDAAVLPGSPASDSLTDLYVRRLSGFENYEVPAVVIDDEVSPEAIARIFERVNRLGEPLGTFDLMVAKSFTDTFNLRDRWDKAKTEYPRIQAFLGTDGGLAILNVIALRMKNSIRQADVLALTGPQVRHNWDRAVLSTELAISYLETHLGVWLPDWLPYKAILTVLAGISWDRDPSSIPSVINQWFWRSSLGARYDVASNTRAVEDFNDLLGRSESGAVAPDGDRQLLIDREAFLQTNRRQFGSLHRALVCAMAVVQSRSSLKKVFNSTDYRDGELPEVVLISLVPKAPSGAESFHLRTLSFILCSLRDARRVSKPENLSEKERAEYLVPAVAIGKNYGARFVSARAELLIAKIFEFTGILIRLSDEDSLGG